MKNLRLLDVANVVLGAGIGLLMVAALVMTTG